MTSVSQLGLVVPDPALESEILAGIGTVEEMLRDAVKSDYPFVTETSRHLVEAGGKRFRPLLTLLAAQFGDPTSPGVLPAAVVVELTHLATLYHDDVMDEAPVRRGTISANARWSNTIAILTGDFLFSRASDMLADLGPDAVRIQARTFERLVQGQIRETVGPEPGVDPMSHYLRVVADKTGSLISTSARFGAMFAGAPDHVVDVMIRYGERVGVAFQLSDDLLDITSESSDSGKTPGTDLREGVTTLPVLHARRSTDPSDARLLELLGADLSDDDRHRETLTLLRAHAAIKATRADVERWAKDARDTLRPLPDGPPKRALEALCDFVVARTS
ncbi:MAG TPA: polyprenyl synthetase family protein [Acidothermaceae bacterium]